MLDWVHPLDSNSVSGSSKVYQAQEAVYFYSHREPIFREHVRMCKYTCQLLMNECCKMLFNKEG